MKNVLLRVECQERQIQYYCDPVSVDEEKESKESVNGGFRDNVGIESIT